MGLTFEQRLEVREARSGRVMADFPLVHPILLAGDPSALKRAEDVCRQGHLIEGENAMVDTRGRRRCRECAKASKRQWHHANRGTGKGDLRLAVPHDKTPLGTTRHPWAASIVPPERRRKRAA